MEILDVGIIKRMSKKYKWIWKVDKDFSFENWEIETHCSDCKAKFHYTSDDFKSLGDMRIILRRGQSKNFKNIDWYTAYCPMCHHETVRVPVPPYFWNSFFKDHSDYD